MRIKSKCVCIKDYSFKTYYKLFIKDDKYDKIDFSNGEIYEYSIIEGLYHIQDRTNLIHNFYEDEFYNFFMDLNEWRNNRINEVLE